MSRYAYDTDDRLDAASSDLCEIAAFAMETLDEDPEACIPQAAALAVDRAFKECGMEGVRDLLGHYERKDKQMRLEARREAA